MKDLLEASIDIDASPAAVWAVVSDLGRMGEFSPECRKVKVFGVVREGARTVNLNRRKLFVWPTMSKVVRYEPERAIAFAVRESRQLWSYELAPSGDGTLLTERREPVVEDGVAVERPMLAKVVAKYALGGLDEHDDELADGMRATLTRIKAAVEAA